MNDTPPVSVTLQESCRLSGLGLSKIYAAISDGTLESVTIGKRRLVMYHSLRRMIEAGRSLPSDTRPSWTPPSPALRRVKPEAKPVAPTRIRRRSTPVTA
jgi:hypothetical protein